MDFNQQVQNLIDSYKKKEFYELEDKLNLYSQKPLLGAINDAVFGFYIENGQKNQCSHQAGIDVLILKRVVELLMKIDEQRYSSKSSFEELYTLIESNSNVSGFGPLCIYDTALRLGAVLGLAPEKVYLHRGARTGAIYVGIISEGSKAGHISISRMPDIFHQLEPMHIENFLCIYKDKLKKIVAG